MEGNKAKYYMEQKKDKKKKGKQKSTNCHNPVYTEKIETLPAKNNLNILYCKNTNHQPILQPSQNN